MSSAQATDTTDVTSAKPSPDTSPGQVLLRWPALKYVGFALLLAWHYCFWFVPNVFVHTALLDDYVTYAWLANLASTVVSLLVIAFAVGRKRHLSNMKGLSYSLPFLLCLATLALAYIPFHDETLPLSLLLAVAMGPIEALFWILWGEHYARNKSHFTMTHIGTVFGISLLVTICIALMLPGYLAALFTCLLPLVSGFLYLKAEKGDVRPFPPLLPRKASAGALKSIFIVCFISFVASIACYFLAAIIPWQALPTRDVSFTIGVMGGAVILLLIAGVCHVSKNAIDVFKMLPWLIVMITLATALFLADSVLYFPAFIMAIGISSIFEIMLIMYFGILTSKGYVAPALAFALSASSIRLGIFIGNSIAIIYEKNPEFAALWTPETGLLFASMLVIVLIPLVRREYAIAAMTTTPQTANELDTICDEVAGEFKLSARESEILHLLAYGHTADSVAKKLVISPYTVNTHIRHIYEKMQIHKRAELLNYINMRRTDL